MQHRTISREAARGRGTVTALTTEHLRELAFKLLNETDNKYAELTVDDLFNLLHDFATDLEVKATLE